MDVSGRARRLLRRGGVVPATAESGLAGRVAAVGDRLDLDSPPGAGTQLTVELPCAS